MKNLKKLSVMIFALAMGSFLTISCKKDNITETGPQLGNIVEVASANPEFSSLVAAIKRAGLESFLTSGNYTVFAPTNAAFASLLTELGFSSLDDIPVETLKSVLLYHVITGKVASSAIVSGYVSTNSSGPATTKLSLYIKKTGADVKLDNRANVNAVDIAASNGVIHVIDKVLMPGKIVQAAINNPNFSTLVTAVIYADLVTTLNSAIFTVFAPSNAAFSALLTKVGADSVTTLPKETVVAILLDHVVSGNITSKDLMNGNVIPIGGDTIIVSGTGNARKLNSNINITTLDIQTANGVLHEIDKVIFN
jgi:transforming growth factor-beta-induced protein